MFLSGRHHPRCTMSFAPEMLGDVFFVGLKHVSVHVIVHPRRGIFIRLRHLYMQQIYLLTIIVTEENLVANSPRSRRGYASPHPLLSFLHVKLLLNLSPFPRKSRTSLHTALLPSSLSSAPYPPPPAAPPLTRAGSTRARASLPPRSVYIHHRRERSRRYFSI